MSKPELLCRNATVFAEDGSIDEEAYRQLLQRLVARIGIYLASAGSDESGAMFRPQGCTGRSVGSSLTEWKRQSSPAAPM